MKKSYNPEAYPEYFRIFLSIMFSLHMQSVLGSQVAKNFHIEHTRKLINIKKIHVGWQYTGPEEPTIQCRLFLRAKMVFIPHEQAVPDIENPSSKDRQVEVLTLGGGKLRDMQVDRPYLDVYKITNHGKHLEDVLEVFLSVNCNGDKIELPSQRLMPTSISR